jgi:hypothetical protein
VYAVGPVYPLCPVGPVYAVGPVYPLCPVAPVGTDNVASVKTLLPPAVGLLLVIGRRFRVP